MPHEISARTALPGMILTDHRFTLPLDHAAPNDGRTIDVFAREVVAGERRHDDLPWLVFLQGGPGSASPRPETRDGWLGRALRDYRVLLLDQRGTGLSSPVDSETTAALGPAEAQAEHLSHFRADAIVADAEAIRRELTDGEPWTVLGQSFGGFCVVRYLSAAPEGLAAALITGGIPSLTRPAEDVYRATYPRVLAKNRQFFDRWPHLQDLCRRVADTLIAEDVRLPNGQRLTVRQFQQLGNALGASTGGARLAALLERAFVTVDGRERLSYAFRHGVFAFTNFHTNPIFTVLHEPIYAQGEATAWAAQRVRREFPAFDYEPGAPFLFTGEMVYPWMLDEYETLGPLKGAAAILAAKDDWPALYDMGVLAANRVPTAAALYHHDMYVPLDLALESVDRIGTIATWLTSEYEHDGLRTDGARIVDRLLTLLPVDPMR